MGSVIGTSFRLLIVGAGVTIAQGAFSGSENVVAVVAFTVLGACTVAIPTVAYLVLGAPPVAKTAVVAVAVTPGRRRRRI